MVFLKEKVVGNKRYYYLQHTIRTAGGVKTLEKYLGDKPTSDTEALKRRFLAEIFSERWHPLLERIKENYVKTQAKLPKSVLEKQVRTFSVKFTYDTNRIEGSTLTYRETADLLERGLTPRARPIRDIKEAESHEKVFQELLAYKKDLTMRTVLYWHKKLLEGTKPDIAGQVRQHQVAISGSRFLPPSPAEVPALLHEFFKWYAKSKLKTHPVELAALAHLKSVTIHPFGDGNGRVSRLLMNFVLHKHGYPLFNVPYENRGSYYHALERSQTKNNDVTFIQWFVKKYVKENKEYTK